MPHYFIWDDFIALVETEISRLQESVDMMGAGTLDVRVREKGKWVSRGALFASQHTRAIERLQAILGLIKVERDAPNGVH